MTEIIPSVIANSFEEVKQKITQIDDLTAWAQLDIMDGKFVDPTTWKTADDLEMLDGKIRLDVHLMVVKPEDELKLWLSFVDRILVHVEATDHLAEIVEVFKGTPAKLGLVLKIDTPLDVLEDFATEISYVQLMSIDTLGYYGGKFDERIYDRIRQIKKTYPQIMVGIDGGVNLDNAFKLKEAGADNLIVGSAIWNSENIQETIKKFQAL